jgi:hypothetical protein
MEFMIPERVERVDVSDGTSVPVDPELSECFCMSKEDFLFAGSKVWVCGGLSMLTVLSLST